MDVVVQCEQGGSACPVGCDHLKPHAPHTMQVTAKPACWVSDCPHRDGVKAGCVVIDNRPRQVRQRDLIGKERR